MPMHPSQMTVTKKDDGAGGRCGDCGGSKDDTGGAGDAGDDGELVVMLATGQC